MPHPGARLTTDWIRLYLREPNLRKDPKEMGSWDRGRDTHLKRARMPSSLLPLPGFGRLCYNGAAVEQGVKPISAYEVTGERVLGEHGVAGESGSSSLRFGAVPVENQRNEDASRFCPVCSQRLES